MAQKNKKVKCQSSKIWIIYFLRIIKPIRFIRSWWVYSYWETQESAIFRIPNFHDPAGSGTKTKSLKFKTSQNDINFKIQFYSTKQQNRFNHKSLYPSHCIFIVSIPSFFHTQKKKEVHKALKLQKFKIQVFTKNRRSISSTSWLFIHYS